jgi:hypothetical protein
MSQWKIYGAACAAGVLAAGAFSLLSVSAAAQPTSRSNPRPTPEARDRPGAVAVPRETICFSDEEEGEGHGPRAERPESRCGVDRIASPLERRRMEAFVRNYVPRRDIARTIRLPSGDVVDCVPIARQPAMRAAGMRGHRIQLLPSRATLEADRAARKIGRPDGREGDPQGEKQAARQEYGSESETCPSGTIPIRRITMEILRNFRTLEEFFNKTPPKKGPTSKHQYAHAYRDGDNWGGQTILNVWSPYTERADEFSLSQMWVVRGSGSSRETVEAGWQKYHDLYGDYNPRLFIYFTPDNYGSGGCYNLDCGAFVQVASSVYIGGKFSNVSKHPHPSTAWEFKLRWQKDGTEGHWWLKYGDTWVGYYPRSKFDSNGLRNLAAEVDFGGEITNKPSGSKHTATDMGSGHFPSGGSGYAAYQRQVRYITTGNVWGTYPALTESRTDKDCYDIKTASSSGDWERYFYYGGSGYNSQCE